MALLSYGGPSRNKGGAQHANFELEAVNALAGIESGSDEERVYLASKNRRHFHRPQCKWTAYIPSYLLIEFGSHAEAVAASYKPCKTCRA